MPIRVCVAGATGWTGSAVVERVLALENFELTGAIARQAAGTDLGDKFGPKAAGIKITATLEEALAGSPQVLIDYTSSESIKERALAALEVGGAGRHRHFRPDGSGLRGN